ncbi:MAG: HIT family hydrolase [Bacteroidetes bacterium RIFCSPHIGHO2_02_FULL_44_7]|nr:MAG: HIT family hydrolase [Bacteroidetes bacterium RIFCSPHIGHO2_02_FULL_44_7]
MATLFTKIIQGEIPCHKVHESEEFLAFLDIMPVRKGHVLVVPKLEIDYIFELEDDHLGRMMAFSKEVAAKIAAVFPCKKVGITVIGLEVPHAHIHLIPINSLSDMDFTKEKLQLTREELEAIAQALYSA